jgi:drug/metabolite transporter (DMT)-like permease
LKRTNQIGAIFAIIACVIWSGNFVISRYAIHLAGPISLAFFRWSIATLIMFPLSYVNFKKELPIILNNKVYFFWMGLVGFAIYNTLIYTAGHFTTAINMALIGSVIHPIVATVLAAIFVNEKLHWKNIAGIVLGLIGIVFLITKGQMTSITNFRFSTGDLWMVAAGICFGTYNVFVRKKPVGISSNSFLFVLFAIGAILLLPFSIYESIYVQPVVYNLHFLYVVLYLGIGNSTISYFFWNNAIHKLGASKTALF